MLRSVPKLLWLLTLLVAMQFPLASRLSAHAGYESSVPAASETVSQVPQQVQVRFTQELFRREGSNSLEVYGPGEVRVDLDDSAIDDDDRKLMTVSLQADLSDGDYTVRWRTLSADDGDEADGEFSFTLRAGSPTAETDQPAPTATVQPDEPVPEATTTAQPEGTGQEVTPTAEGASSAAGEPPSEQASPGPVLPCMGSSFPVLLLLGSLILRRGRGKKN